MIVKIILLGICVCILNIVLRQNQSSFTVIVNISFIVIVCVLMADQAVDYIKDIRDLFDFEDTADKMLSCLFKGAIICVLTKISSDLCKESNNIIVSDIIDLSGRIMLLIIAYPFIENVIKAASTFVL